MNARDVGCWPIASFRGDAAIQSLSERSEHSAGFISTRPNTWCSIFAGICGRRGGSGPRTPAAMLVRAFTPFASVRALKGV